MTVLAYPNYASSEKWRFCGISGPKSNQSMTVLAWPYYVKWRLLREKPGHRRWLLIVICHVLRNWHICLVWLSSRIRHFGLEMRELYTFILGGGGALTEGLLRLPIPNNELILTTNMGSKELFSSCALVQKRNWRGFLINGVVFFKY